MKVHWFWCVLVGFDVFSVLFVDFGQNPHALFMLFMRFLCAFKKRIKSV